MWRLIGVISILAVLAAACGTGLGGEVTDVRPSTSVTPTSTIAPPPSDDPTASPATPAARYFVEVYFVRDGRYADARTTAVPPSPAIATSAVEALLAGPSAEQVADGLTTAVPAGTRLRGLDILDGTARIDLSPEFVAGADGLTVDIAVAQVVHTLVQFPTVGRVQFLIDGRSVEVSSTDGLQATGPLTTNDVSGALPLAPTTTDRIALWGQSDLPPAGEAGARRVVLLGSDDALNVRVEAGVENPVLGMLAPGTLVAVTGSTTDVDDVTWWEVVTPRGAGWTSGHYLATLVDDGVFLADYRVITLLDRMASIMAERGDLSEVVSARGLYISHNADPVLFTPERLPGLLADPTTYKWPSNAIDMSDSEAVDQEIPDRTFAEAVADSFVSTWSDPDWVYAVDRPLSGGNGRLPVDAIPDELAGLHYISAFDRGDDPGVDGMDWTAWHVSIDYEDGAPVVVGLTLDQWAP